MHLKVNCHNPLSSVQLFLTYIPQFTAIPQATSRHLGSMINSAYEIHLDYRTCDLLLCFHVWMCVNLCKLSLVSRLFSDRTLENRIDTKSKSKRATETLRPNQSKNRSSIYQQPHTPGKQRGSHQHHAAAAKSLQSCLTLCDPTDSSPPGSSVPGILQARTLEWVAISFSDVWQWKVKVKLLSRVGTLRDPMDCSPPGSSIHGIFQARILEWAAISFSTPAPRSYINANSMKT